MDFSQEIADGFGVGSVAELQELRKALDIGYSQPVTGTGFDALRVESLESTLKLLSYSTQHLKMWNDIEKLPAYSTVEEYNRLIQYGDDAGGFVQSGALPEEEDSTYERADQKVKYIGTTRGINHPATLIRTVPADLIAQETSNGTLWILGKINRGLYFADADAIPLEWNGLVKQIEDGGGYVVDCRGQGVTSANIEDAAQSIVDSYGVPTKMYSNPRVFTEFSKNYTGQQRWNGAGQNPGSAGVPINGYDTLAGRVSFQSDTFVKAGSAPPNPATSAKAPSAPTVAFAVNAPTQAGSLFATADAGNYVYQVTAVNNYGESLPSAVSAAQTVAAGGSVTLTITDGGGTYPATAYKVYRSTKAGSTTSYIGKMTPRSATNGVYNATTAWTDLNAYLPGCFVGLMLDVTTQSLAFKQLSPLVKIPLAITSPSIRWMQLLYGTPVVYAPKKNVVFRNVGY